MRRGFLKIIAGAIAGWILVEGLLAAGLSTPLAWVLPAVEPQLGMPDPDTGYAFIPGARGLWIRENRAEADINALGLRDDPMTRARRDGVRRVVLTGDSFTEALQVDHAHTFERLAERSPRFRRPTEIANLGMSGNGPLLQLARLEKFGYPLHPDLAVMIFSADDFLSGELLDDSAGPGYKAGPDGEMARSYAFRGRVSQRLSGTAAGAAFTGAMRLSSVFRAAYLELRRHRGGGATAHAVSSAPPDPCFDAEMNRQYAFWIAGEPDMEHRAALRFFQEAAEGARAHAVPLVIGLRLVLPPASCGTASSKRDAVLSVLRGRLEALGIRVVDWNREAAERTGAIREGEDGMKPLYGFGLALGNGHLNYDGHRVFAGVLADAIGDGFKDPSRSP